MRNIIVYNLKDWKKMLKEGQTVYFIVQGIVMSGTVINVKGNEKSYTFEIEGFGNCSGPHQIHLNKFHYSIFLDEKEAQNIKIIPLCIYKTIVNIIKVLTYFKVRTFYI